MIQNQLHRPLPGTIRHRVMAATLAVSVASGVILGIPHLGVAQNDGTGAATPTPPSNCLVVQAEAEVVVPEVTAPQATPVASPVAPEAATPVASPIASPVVDEVDPETAAINAELQTELETTTQAIFGCLNERDFAGYAQVTSDAYRGQLFGSDQPLDAATFVELAEALPASENTLVELADVRVADHSTVTAEVTYVSAFQQRTGVWTFEKQKVDGLDTWVLASEQVVPVETPVGVYVIDVTFEDSGYNLDPDTANGSDVVLNLSNPTDSDHEALVLRLDEGVTTDALLQSTTASLPEGVTLIGQSTVLAGGQGTMFLTGLEPGTYTIVDLLPAGNGMPNLSNGMSATFTVED